MAEAKIHALLVVRKLVWGALSVNGRSKELEMGVMKLTRAICSRYSVQEKLDAKKKRWCS
eukprot:10704882-Prorocentrum_lima.AAC.1